MSATEIDPVMLDAFCIECQAKLVLADTADGMICRCPVCDETTEGATPSDAVSAWLAQQPAPAFIPTSIHDFVVPKHPWVIEVDGIPFHTLDAAEKYAVEAQQPIMCRIATSRRKAVNES